MWNRSSSTDPELLSLEKKIRQTPAGIDLTDRVMRACRSDAPPARGRRPRISRMRASAATAALLLGVAIGSSYVSPVMAATVKQIPGMATLFSLAGDLGLKTADERGLSIGVEARDTHGGVTVSASVAVFDGTRVSLGMERSGGSNEDSGMNFESRIRDIRLSIDGEDVQAYAPPGTSNPIGIYTFPSGRADSMILEFADLKNQGGESFPDAFSLGVRVELDGIAQPFRLTIPIEKSTADNVTLRPSEQRSYEGVDFRVDKIESTPITTSISTTIAYPDRATLDRENPLRGFDVYDDRGNPVNLIAGSGWNDGSGRTQIAETRFEPFAETPEFIVIKPYLNAYADGKIGEFKLDAEGKPEKTYIPELEMRIDIR